MRFNESAILTRIVTEQREDGSFREVKHARGVFVNSYSLGGSAYMAARSAGLHADMELQVRTCDYLGEEQCTFHGMEYEVERSVASGDFTLLTLKRRVRNG